MTDVVITPWVDSGDPDGFKYSMNRFQCDGSANVFSINFAGVTPGYLDRGYVKYYTIKQSDGTRSDIQVVPVSAWQTNSTIKLEQSPGVPFPSGYWMVIFRDTPKDKPLVDFSDGSVINEENLDLLARQSIYVAAEMVDRFEELLGSNQEIIDRAAEALAKANQAITDSTTAVNTANAASSKADGAISTANSAVTTANGAVTTANGAVATANNALSVANGIDAKAQQALDVANGIDAKATQALNNSNTAINTANSANTKADQALATASGNRDGIWSSYKGGNYAGLGMYRGTVASPGNLEWLIRSGVGSDGSLYMSHYPDASGAPDWNPITLSVPDKKITLSSNTTLDVGGARMENVGAPVNGGDAATKQFVLDNLFGWRNRIINGGCFVRQRPGGLKAVTTANTYGPVDRFMSSIGGGTDGTLNIDTTTLAIPSGPTNRIVNCVMLTCTKAATNIAGGAWVYGINQVIEGYNCYDLVGQPVTISFWWQSNVTGTFAVALRNTANAWSCVQSFNYTTANVPQYVTIKVPAMPAGLTIPQDNSVGLFLSVGSLNTGNYQCPAGSVGTWQNANYITVPGVTNWMSAVNNWVRITEVQLERGTEATTFERRPAGIEVALCQRYYEILIPKRLYISGLTGTTTAFDDQRFAVTKRASPVVTAQGLSYFSSGNSQSYSPTTIAPNAQGFSWTLSGATNWQGWVDSGFWFADADF